MEKSPFQSDAELTRYVVDQARLALPHGWVGMAMSGLLCLGAPPMFGSAFTLTAVPRMSTARHQRRGVD
jgi:hypothetical protein